MPETDIQTPAIITDDHAQTRHVTTRAGAKKGWERLTVYEKEFRLGHLTDKKKILNEATKAEEIKKSFERRDAAKEFDEGWQICLASWPGGMDMNRIGVVGVPGGFCDHQRDVKRFWERVRQEMGTNDWMICRRVCGEGYKVAETIAVITPSYKDSALVRFREALDSLLDALGKVRR